MSNKMFAILISLFTFVVTTSSYAENKILIKGVESNVLQQVVGQPNHQPTLIVYNASTCGYDAPKYKVFSSIAPQTLDYYSFNELVPTTQSSLNGQYLSAIIWFNNNFYGYTRSCLENGKNLFVQSKDGQKWVTSELSGQGVVSDFKAMVGSGKSDNPTLAAVGTDGRIYYKNLNSDDHWQVSDFLLNNPKKLYVQLVSYHHQFFLSAIDVSDESSFKSSFYLSADGKNWKSIVVPENTMIGGAGSMFSVSEDKLFSLGMVNNQDVIVELGVDESNNTLVIQDKIAVPQLSATTPLALYNVIYSSATKAYYFIFEHNQKSYWWLKADNLQEVTAANLHTLNIENNNPFELSNSDDGLSHNLFMFKDEIYFLAGINVKSSYFQDSAIYNLLKQ